MRLIWTDEGRTRARAHGLRVRTIPQVLAMLVVIACGDGSGSAGDTDGTTGGMPTSTEATGTMSGGPGGPTTQTSTTASDSTSTAGDSTGEASTGEPGTSATEGSGTTGTPETGSSGSGSSGGGSSSTGETGTTGGIMSQDCADGCVVEFQCGIQWKSAEECTEFCNANLAAAAQFSPWCMQAWEELSACLGALDCEQFNQWQAAAMFPYPCYQEDDALAFECDGQ